MRAHREPGVLEARQQAVWQMDCRGRTQRKLRLSSIVRREPALEGGGCVGTLTEPGNLLPIKVAPQTDRLSLDTGNRVWTGDFLLFLLFFIFFVISICRCLFYNESIQKFKN
jgi:hypothetical protein